MSLKYKKFVLFGDSITEFVFNTRMEEGKGDQFSMGAALCNTYARKLDIVHRGFSGYNSRWALKLLPHILENEGSDDIAMCMVFFGSNDAASAGDQQVELPEFTENTKKLVHMLKAKGIKAILVGPALHDREHWAASRPVDAAKDGIFRCNENNKRYSNAVQQVAKKAGVPFVDLMSAFASYGDNTWQELLCDGLHFTGKGYEVFYHALVEKIRQAYPELAPENVVYKLPNWRDLQSDGSKLDEYL
ncbi:LANO_0G15786g1_1 [Lachancea nothofagi CBS 11611]|uniref:LANO_0G15786g1_1 n=1 Tax=Lachancea nothofagi CBS 11611 TaxID=1266666 RepID=A0A1G4KK88_9SACH|nr:LANO_0G15786g1_1 [Lachancea nothofagi CBS 11611]